MQSSHQAHFQISDVTLYHNVTLFSPTAFYVVTLTSLLVTVTLQKVYQPSTYCYPTQLGVSSITGTQDCRHVSILSLQIYHMLYVNSHQAKSIHGCLLKHTIKLLLFRRLISLKNRKYIHKCLSDTEKKQVLRNKQTQVQDTNTK